jgi:carbon monoxide dehydrogenase subunit G
MIKKIVLVLAIVISAILLFAATKPATFHVERSTTINAPADAVHAYLIDFHKWDAWSPWEKYDPGMKRTYDGPSSGTGAIYTWNGNSAVGEGRMEIIGVTPTKVNIKLDFLSPMEAHNTVAFALQPQGAATQVLWTMDGENNYLSKLMQVFASMDSMIGKDFESGLADLKAAAEKTAAAAPQPASPSTP